tara:strand:- start:179 stop:886 length:708 start_codon:yes stop_codon:yes gene_type:complete
MEEQVSNQLINNFTNFSVTITFIDALTILIISLFIGLYFRFLFNRFTNTFSSKIAFGNSILLIIVSVAALIAVVKSSLALSLGLVGALSVVRFRTAVKEPFNLAFLLLSICVGIAIGASQYLFALILTILSTFMILLIYRERSNKKKRSLMPLLEEMDTFAIAIPSNSSIDKIITKLFEYTEFFKVVSYDSSNDNGINLVAKIRINDQYSLIELEKNMLMEFPKASINFYSSPLI